MRLEPAVVNIQRSLLEGDRRFTLGVIVALSVAVGLVAGAYVAILSPVYAIAAVLAAVAGVLMLRDTQWGFIAAHSGPCT